nr:hypothetical protein [Tanacetum cinerariifolium]
MMALIQSQQALLDQFGYNGNVHVTVASQNVNSTTMNLIALHTSMVQPILGVNNPPGFPQHYIGPHQLLVQTAQSAQPAQGSNPVGHETLLPNAFSAMMLQHRGFYAVTTSSTIPHAFLTSQYT